MRPIKWSRVAINLTVLALIVVWTVPTIGLFITSFRDKQAISNSGWWTVFTNPQGAFTLDNYQKVLFGGDGLATAFLNTLAVTIPAVVIPILIAAFAAYGFAWMSFPGRRVLFITVVALLVVPLQIALIPVLKAYLAIDLNGTFLAVWLAHAGFGLALATYLLYNYISQLPKDIIESAALDGASHFTTFRRLILPLSMPALASFAIFQFLWVWNDLLVATTFLGTDQDVAVMTGSSSLPARSSR
jgi:alpha-glucoside transport system permease protein